MLELKLEGVISVAKLEINRWRFVSLRKFQRGLLMFPTFPCCTVNYRRIQYTLYYQWKETQIGEKSTDFSITNKNLSKWFIGFQRKMHSWETSRLLLINNILCINCNQSVIVPTLGFQWQLFLSVDLSKVFISLTPFQANFQVCFNVLQCWKYWNKEETTRKCSSKYVFLKLCKTHCKTLFPGSLSLSFQPAALLKKLLHKCFPVIFYIFLRTLLL